MAKRRNVIQQAWDGTPPIAKAVAGGVVTISLVTIAKRQYDKYQENQALKKAQAIFDNSNKPITTIDQTGKAVTVTINTATTATKIHDAIYNNDWFGATEDEEAIVTNLKAVPKIYMSDVEKNYLKLYNKNLQQDVIKALSSDQWLQVDYLFN